jgi:hypothetical protein
MPKAFAEPPIDTFRRHVFVSPYYGDDILAGFDERELRLILRENTRRLIESPSAAA